MQKAVSWLRQPTTLGGLAVLIYLALKAWLPAYVGADLPEIAAAAMLIITPDNTAGAVRAAKAVEQLENLTQGAQPHA